MKKHKKNINIISHNSKVKIALKILNNPKINTIFLINKKNSLVGTITDGDLRRGFLKGFDLNDSANLVMKKKFKFIKKGKEISNQLTKYAFSKNKIQEIPLLDRNDKILKILNRKFIEQKSFIKKNDFIIMAGGLGKRLRPLTKKKPKAMIEVFNKPMIKHIIDSANSYGFKNFFISVNYLKKIIEDFLKDGSKFGVNINYIREKKPLGTAGSIGLIKSNNNLPVIIVNGDTFTDVNYNSLIKYHTKAKADFTVVSCLKKEKQEIGILETNLNVVTKLNEKPLIIKKINAGIYVMSKPILKLIKKDKYLDMTDFIKMLIKKKKRIISFPIYEK